MTDIDIDAIRERERVILPGPWRVGETTPTGPDLWELPILLDRAGPDGPQTIQVCAVEYQTGGFHYPHADAKADAEFIAHARIDVPALLAKVDELTAERDNALSAHEVLAGKHAALAITADDLTADLTQSRAQAATYANEIGTLKAELEHLREQVFAQKPVVEAAQAWAEMVEIGGDAPGDARKVEDALHDAIEQHRLMDMALTSARAEHAEATR